MKLFKKSYYEQIFAKKETNIQDCYNVIREMEQRIETLRAACPHPESRPTMFMARPGAFHPCRLCTSCDAVVPGITDEEAKQMWQDFNKGFNSTSGVITTFKGTK